MGFIWFINYIFVDEFTPYLDQRTDTFMEALKDDPKAILSLYVDASYHHAVEGKTVLDDARLFSSKYLHE